MTISTPQERRQTRTNSTDLASVVQGKEPTLRPVVFAVLAFAIRLYVFDVVPLDRIQEALGNYTPCVNSNIPFRNERLQKIGCVRKPSVSRQVGSRPVILH